MSISQTNFNGIRESYKLIFAGLERAFAKLGIDFYLIGAQSRDVWTNHLPILKRTTNDIDFAVLINDQPLWNDLVQYLIMEEKFTQDKKQPYRFYLEGNMLDLIPFGGMEKNGEVILENPLTELSVYGCLEVTEDATVLSGKYKVITLPGLCIMKLIAFDEKPDQRAKDWDDFKLIFTNYGEIAGEELFSGHYEDLFNADFELPVASARMLGRNMQEILNKNENLKKKIVEILKGRLQKFTREEIDQMYLVREKDDELVFNLKMLTEIIRGISDEHQ